MARKKNHGCLAYIAIISAVFYLLNKLYDLILQEWEIFLSIFIFLGFFIALFVATYLDKNRERRRKINQESVSHEPSDYVIRRGDYVRNNKVDAFYRKEYFLTILKAYDNRCAKCGTDRNGVDLDHCFIPKSLGGNFCLWHKDDFWINNAVPLCRTCNRSKGNRFYKEYFTDEQLLILFKKNKEMTQMLNRSEKSDSLKSYDTL